jgi:uncharacterized membrane protein (DUF2068 family)
VISAAWGWVRWEAHREIQVTRVIELITIERFIKGAILIFGGIALVVAGEATDLHRLAQNIQEQAVLQPDASLLHRAINALLERLGRASDLRRDEIAGAAVLYGLIEVVEGVGLLRRRRWAEYLVLIATSAFLPLEVDEMLRHPSPFKAGALLVNIAIIVYLVWRKRLFLERPSTTTAESPA